MTFQFNRDIIDPSAAGPVDDRIFGQWVNGNALSKTLGVLAIPVENLPGEPTGDFAKLWKPREVTFPNGSIVVCVVAEQPILTVVRKRFTWYTTDGKTQTYYPYKQYKDGMRGKIHILAGVYGFDEPVYFTFTGTASKAFNEAWKEFNEKVIDPQNKNRKLARVPAYAFWMKLKSGQLEEVGSGNKKSKVTKPMIVLPDNITDDYLAKIYVGDDIYKRHEGWALDPENIAWSKEWSGNEPMTPSGNIESHYEEEPEDPPPPF